MICQGDSTSQSFNDINQTIDDNVVHTIIQDLQKNLSSESISELKDHISSCKNIQFTSISESLIEDLDSKNTSYTKIYEKPSFVQLSPELFDDENLNSSQSSYKFEQKSKDCGIFDKKLEESLHTILETNSERFFDNALTENCFTKTNSFSFQTSEIESDNEQLKFVDNFEKNYNICSKLW